MAAADESLRQVREQAATAQAQEEAARSRLALARRARAFWEELLTLLDAGQPAGALLVLRREADAVPQQGPDSIPMGLLEGIVNRVEQQARAQAAGFQRTFPTALQAAGVALDATSRHPRYTVHSGFLHVEVDDQLLTATVQPRDGTVILLGMDLEPLVLTIRREAQRLFDRHLDYDAFLRRLWTAYQALVQAEGRAPGDALPLRRVLAHLDRDARPYAADECNVDLARLVQSDHTLFEGNRLQLHPTRRAKQGVLLWGLEQGGSAGFISFGQEDE
ncbi:MAG: hypothetical protein ACR2JY_16780 [Chloroflexota bacterium]